MAKKFSAPISLSVRDFALPIPRLGSIEPNSGYGSPTQGVEIHQAVQRAHLSQAKAYRKEVAIAGEFTQGGWTFQVGGRIDGVFEGPPTLLEEIKSSFSLEVLAERLKGEVDHPYLRQLKTYAYLHYLKTGEVPLCRFLLVSMRNGAKVELPVVFEPKEYEVWLERRLAELVQEQKDLEKERRRRLKLAETLAFPFPTPRPGQRELVDRVAAVVEKGGQLLVQAPTGLGKTLGVSFPALKNALSRGQQTLYVTPKNTQQAVALDAAERFHQQGQRLKAGVITAKAKICLMDEPVCSPKFCPYAKDYYQKVYEHDLLRKLAKRRVLTARTFKAFGRQYEVCPFQLALDSVKSRDLVICDYNYVFSPNGALKEPKVPKGAPKPNLVIDEAHNLHARATDYFSPLLSLNTLESMRARVAALPARFAKRGVALLDQGARLITSYRPSNQAPIAKISIASADFTALGEKLAVWLCDYLESDVEIAAGDVVLELVHYWGEFSQALSSMGESEEFFTTYRRLSDAIKINCCDASAALAEDLKAYQSVVAFSATLKPFEYYAALSGFDLDSYQTAEFTSPFPSANRKLMVIPQISTKFRDRERNYPKIADAVARIIQKRRGNYFVFFPSFEFLARTADHLKVEGFRLIRQSPEMPAGDARKLIDTLSDGEKNVVVLAAQGGIFAEGVDYPGETLIGAIVVGPALPNYNLERELLRAYYERRYGLGFDYAYTFPAMAKVIQAAGRVIRSENDKGLIVLMDQRFTEPTYCKAMPSDWFGASVQELVSTKILSDIDEFWQSVSPP